MFAGAIHADSGAPRFLALGDSYTIGEGVDEAQRWPAQLVRGLRANGFAIDAATIVAKTGWRTDELAHAIGAASLKPPYALVTLMIGVNDQYQGRDVDQYRNGFASLLRRAIALAGNDPQHVIVISIPDWGVTRFASEQGRDAAPAATAIDAFNKVARAICRADGIAWVDVTTASRVAGASQGELTEDGLHPSARQYARWVDAILPAAAAVLGAH
ncbi:MAG: SGNH/GDSL hydrolase family protein [Rhodanobacteraceae bacterium]